MTLVATEVYTCQSIWAGSVGVLYWVLRVLKFIDLYHVLINKLMFSGLKIQEKELEADYEIGVVLGNGGFGTVYAGTRRRDGKRVRFVTVLDCSSLVKYLSELRC